ncbi:hypothetical protein SMKI_04G5130 [Saccharomyces mikatae IFO 1815]|uniref:Uncharacterized protein n=1 Tax=Saccharomyces mikatae IFO 1815 TaxID=226126 RepID=A0AA35IWF0_SACMI|nr:uncharacterized protein SMKI_04G5130 [Saccharomyces mikatae IFO 1815]CAI4038173.1 hypothetical protein SMKI_04G5130 [Saccharomyces mikatae IFO 1815]
MINKDKETGEIHMRHYFIDIREVDISRNLKRLYKAKNNLGKAVPNVHRKEDISSLILDHDLGAYTSESEIEDDAILRMIDNQNVKAKHFQSSKSQKTSVEKIDDEEHGKNTEVVMEENKRPESSQVAPCKKFTKLTELRARRSLKLVKTEEGICSGKVLHHEYVLKSSEEIRTLERGKLGR